MAEAKHRSPRVTVKSLKDEAEIEKGERRSAELILEKKIDDLRTDIANGRKLSSETERLAALAFTKNSSQDRAITRAYERIQRHEVRLDAIEAQLKIAEERVELDNPALTERTARDVDDLSAQANPILDALDADFIAFRKHVEEEFKRVDKRIDDTNTEHDEDVERLDGDIKKVDGRVSDVQGDLDLTKRDVSEHREIITRISGASFKVPIWPLIIGFVAGFFAFWFSLANGFWSAFQNAWGWTFGVAGFIYIVYYIAKLASSKRTTETVEERHETNHTRHPGRAHGILARLGLAEEAAERREHVRTEPVQRETVRTESVTTEPVRTTATTTRS